MKSIGLLIAILIALVGALGSIPATYAQGATETATPEAEQEGAEAQQPTAPETPQTSDADVTVVAMSVAPPTPNPGDTITIDVTLVNFGGAAATETFELYANGVVVDTASVSLEPRENKDVRFSFEAGGPEDVVIALSGVTREVKVVESGGLVSPRIGPTVRLDVRQDIITDGQDALIDLFWDNSILNSETAEIELTVDVPSGLYLYSGNGVMSCAAGMCKGLFEAPPGDVRNMPLIVKGDRVGDYFVHLNGRYWPESCPECWNPISLSTSLTVNDPPSADTGPPPQTSTCDSEWMRCPSNTQMAMMALAALALVALAAVWAIPKAMKAGRPKIDVA